MRRHPIQAVTGALFAGALLCAVVPGVATASALPGASAARLTVTPHTNLRDGQYVHVRLSGFKADASIAAAECKEGGPLAESDCDISTSLLATTSATGTYAFTYQVARYITVGGTKIDCAVADSCVFGAARWPDIAAQHAGVVLGFNPKLKPIRPTLKIAPASDLVPNAPVTVTGTGYRPNSTVGLEECTTGATNSFASCSGITNNLEVSIPSSGDLAATYRPSDLLVELARTGAAKVSCEAKPGCSLVVFGTSTSSASAPSVPLAFAAGAIPEAPTLSVSPRSGLADGQFVTISASGFTPGDEVEVTECVPGDLPQLGCSSNDYETVVATATGAASATFPVQEKVNEGSKTVDCAAVSCTVFVADEDDAWYSASRTLTFDPSLPAVRPTVAAAPSTGLVNGQVITVTGNGFTPGAPVLFTECAGRSGTCQDYEVAGRTTADAAGGFDAGFTVTNQLQEVSKTITCSATVACHLEAFSEQDAQQAAGALLSF